MTVGRVELLRLTVGKAVANTALRWIPFFLPTLALAFDASTAPLTTVLGVGEMAGLSTLAIGGRLDAGHERPLLVGALGLIVVSAALALVGTLAFFTTSFVLLILGVSTYTVAGHTYLSQRAAFERRGRVIGIFETSWASALLVGAPIVAVLVDRFGWRGPFVAIAGAATAAAVVVARTEVSPPRRAAGPSASHGPIDLAAWAVVLASAAIAMAGLTTIVIAGTWLDEGLGVSTAGVGVVAMAFGAAELGASSASAVFSDRAGKARTTSLALAAVVIGLVVMTQAGESLVVGASGLLIFCLGFEYAIVTSFSIVSEAVPTSRGRVLAVNIAIGTVARGSGTVASGFLYEWVGIRGPATLSILAAAVAVILLGTSRRGGA